MPVYDPDRDLPDHSDQVSQIARENTSMWQRSLAEATVALLEEGSPVTIESLVGKLETANGRPNAAMSQVFSRAAIDRLYQIGRAKG